MSLQLDGSLFYQRSFFCPVIDHGGIIDHELLIEEDRYPVLTHCNPEMIPFAKRLVGIN